MLTVLGLIDVVMIANLLIMVIVGGYETFVSRLRLEGHPDEPEWLSHVNAGVLKVKLATALIGISSIHLLKTFIEIGTPGTTAKPCSGRWSFTSPSWLPLSFLPGRTAYRPLRRWRHARKVTSDWLACRTFGSRELEFLLEEQAL